MKPEMIKKTMKLFPKSKLIVITPDRGKESQKIIDQFKDEGIKGTWRCSCEVFQVCDKCKT